MVQRKSGQPQLNVSHATTLKLLTNAGQKSPGKSEPVRLGSPAKGKPYLIWSCTTSSGEQFKIVQGDTHAIWLSHQEGDGREKLERLLTQLPVGGKAMFRVLKTDYFAGGDAGPGDDGEVVEVD